MWPLHLRISLRHYSFSLYFWELSPRDVEFRAECFSFSFQPYWDVLLTFAGALSEGTLCPSLLLSVCLWSVFLLCCFLFVPCFISDGIATHWPVVFFVLSFLGVLWISLSCDIIFIRFGRGWKFNSYILKLVSCPQVLSRTSTACLLSLSLVPGVTRKLFSFSNSSPIFSVPVWTFFRLFSLQIYWTLILWLINGW